MTSEKKDGRAHKLTPPQCEVLSEMIAMGGRSHFSSSYPPIKKLLAAGYIEFKPGRYSDAYQIMDAGRATPSSTRKGG